MATILYARSGHARSGATRSGYFREFMQVRIAGIDQGAKITGLVIRRKLSDQPNTATFQMSGAEPPWGAPVIIGNGTIEKRLFAGFITQRSQPSVKQVGGTPTRQIWDVTCHDLKWDLAGEACVLEEYTDTPAHIIFRELATKYSPDYSLSRVRTGAPVIDRITFEGVSLPVAFTQLANRAAAAGDGNWRWDLDPAGRYHFFDVEPLVAQPKPVSIANLDYDDLDFNEAIGGIRTQVIGIGGGGATTAPVAAGATSIPVDECGWYVGTRAKAGNQWITYTGRSVSSGAGLITGVPASGAGSLARPLMQNDRVSVVVVVDDLAAQAALAAATGRSGIRQFVLRDGNANEAGLTEDARSQLALFGGPVTSGGYTTRDAVADAGRLATIDVPGRTTAMTALSVPIDEVEIRFVNPNRTQRKVKFNSAVKLDIVDVIRSIGVAP